MLCTVPTNHQLITKQSINHTCFFYLSLLTTHILILIFNFVRTKKEIIVGFRGSVTLTDWKKNLTYNLVSTDIVRSFARKHAKIHNGYARKLLL